MGAVELEKALAKNENRFRRFGRADLELGFVSDA